jgi:hypothetical protein
MGRAYSTHEELRNAFKILVGKPDEERPLGKPKHRWQYSIKQIRYQNMDLIQMAQDKERRFVLGCY